MNNTSPKRKLNRRDFFKLGGGVVAAAAGARLLPGVAGKLLPAVSRAEASVLATPTRSLHLAATDGWISVPGNVPTFHPDPLAPPPFTSYAFGFRDVTSITDPGMVQDQRNKTQASAPLLWVDELDNVEIKLTNLGLAVRPDLTDSHSIHWHGFRNAIPLFDGVPEMSIAVPIGRDFTYFYHPHEPGTYMYHCHFEDVEHVSMGMTGIVFVRPALGPKFVYNNASTGFDREFGMFLSELWTEERFRDAHIQENDWSDYDPDVWLLNGRSYPDTLAPNGAGIDPDTGDLIPTPGYEHLQYQPISSVVQANAATTPTNGERVLLRFVNLGYQQHAMTLEGITMRIVGKDATLLRGRDGTDLSYTTNTVYIGPGESVDAIFTAPAFNSNPAAISTDSASRQYNKYLLRNRNYAYLHNPGISGLGGQLTEVRVYSPSNPLPAQTQPHQLV